MSQATTATSCPAPAPAQVVCLDLEPYMVEFSAPFFKQSGLSGRIRPVIGPAGDTMKQLAQQGER